MEQTYTNADREWVVVAKGDNINNPCSVNCGGDQRINITHAQLTADEIKELMVDGNCVWPIDSGKPDPVVYRS